MLAIKMSHLNLKSSGKNSYRDMETRKAELSHANFMNTLANCPIVAREDHMMSEYDAASKNDH